MCGRSRDVVISTQKLQTFNVTKDTDGKIDVCCGSLWGTNTISPLAGVLVAVLSSGELKVIVFSCFLFISLSDQQTFGQQTSSGVRDAHYGKFAY